MNIKMQPQVFTLGKGSELTKELMFPGTEEFGIILKGKLELLYDSQKIAMEEGDSIYCSYTRTPKRMINIGETEAKLLWIIFASA